MSFSPEKTQTELAWDVAAVLKFVFGFGSVGGPFTSPAKAALALAPATAAAHTTAVSIEFFRSMI